MKKVSIGAKPQPTAVRLSPDDWVTDRQSAEKIKRLTIDVPLSLHRRIKSQCAIRDVNMADEIRTLLEAHFPGESDRKEPG